MLKQRILTAIVLIPLTLALLFFLPPTLFCLLTAIITLAAAWEWSLLMGLQERWSRVGYLFTVLLVLFVSLFIPPPMILSISAIAWLLATVLVVIYPQGSAWFKTNHFFRGFIGLLVLVPCWVAINFIRVQSDGVYALLFLLVLVWGADSTAYFVGKRWGKTKLAPRVSPGKSIQGALGALVFALFIVIIAALVGHVPLSLWGWGFVLAVFTVIFSIVGDLFESLMKRQAGLKDSGQLLPGHGGLLDRIDSLTAAAPIFAYGAWMLGTYVG